MTKALFTHIPLERVREFWDRRPCNVRHSPKPVGSQEYFEEVEARKYFVEPHIPGFAEFPRWREKRVLEIGCGIGTDTINFARHGALVTAVDLSEASIALARRRAEIFGLADRICFYVADAEELSRFVPVEPYDLVYAFGVLHHTPNPERALAELKKFTKPGTTLKLMVYHRRSWKALGILLWHGKGRFWRLRELVAEHSEAAARCPVAYTYTRREAEALLATCGATPVETRVEHIFPWRVADYVRYRYVKSWPLRWLPARMFSWLERRFGWHVCATGEVPA